MQNDPRICKAGTGNDVVRWIGRGTPTGRRTARNTKDSKRRGGEISGFEFLQDGNYGVLLTARGQRSEKRTKRVKGFGVCVHEQRAGAPDTNFLKPNQVGLLARNLVRDRGCAFRDVAGLDLQVSRRNLNGKIL